MQIRGSGHLEGILAWVVQLEVEVGIQSQVLRRLVFVEEEIAG